MKIGKRMVALMLSIMMLCLSVLTGGARAQEDSKMVGYVLKVVQGEHGKVEITDESEMISKTEENIYKIVTDTTINIKVIPDIGYGVQSLKANGLDISINGMLAEYAMPDEDVTIEAEFIEVSEDAVQEDTTPTKKELPDPDETGESEFPNIIRSLLCDDPECLEKHVGKSLKPEDITGVLVAKKSEGQEARNLSKSATPYVGMVTSGNSADIYFTGDDPSAPGLFVVGFNDGEYLAGIGVDGFSCINHGAANPGVGVAVQGTYKATVTAIDKRASSVTWSVVVTPPDACAPGTVLGYQRVGGMLKTDWSFEQYGNIELYKSSSNPELTEGNSCYSLAGAEYGVYQKGHDDNPVATMVTDNNGYAKVERLLAGQYLVKEIKAPKGFAIELKSHSVNVVGDNTASVHVSDIPQSDPVSIILGKIDSETNLDKPQGSLSLANAEFTIKYFTGFYDTDPEIQGKNALRRWVLRTREDGKTAMLDSLKVDGDEFFKNSNGYNTLPLGTITIQETKAPQGYLINPKVFVRQITSAGDSEGVNTYNQPIIPEQVIRGGVYVEKWDNELNRKNPQGQATLQGAVLQIISENENAVTVKGVAYNKGAVVETLTTDANGSVGTSNNLLPYGDYKLREQTPPGGYQNSGVTERPFSVRENGKVVRLDSSDTAVKDNVIRGGVSVEKWDSELNEKDPQGQATLEGAKFQIISDNRYEVVVNGNSYTKGAVVASLTTDASGSVTTANSLLPYGDYKLREQTPPGGYQNSGVTERAFSIRKQGEIVKLNTSDTAIKNDVIRGGVYIEKWDSELNGKLPQGQATLEGAKFQIISNNVRPVIVNDKVYGKGQTVLILTTDEEGKAETAAEDLPYGDYIAREQRPPDGYQGSGVTERAFSIRKQGEIVKLNTSDTAIKNDVIRGGAVIEKWDSEADGNKPQGNATLAGAEFQLISRNDQVILVDGKTFGKDDVIHTFTTDKDGKVRIPGTYLPYGNYRWKEITPPTGYNHTGTLQRDFEIRENGKIVQMATSSTAIKNDIIRGDIQLVKFKESQDEEEDQKIPLKGIIFTLTSKTTGDKYKITTDKNGYASTKQLGISDRGNLVYDTYTVHETNTPEGLEPVKDFEVTIKNEGETHYYILEDKLILSPVLFLKADSTTGERIPLAGAEFQLLDKDKQPITMTTHYPGTVVHHTYRTDSSGGFTLPEKLPVGVYYWREVLAPEGYQRNLEDLKFAITEGHDWEEPFVVEFEDVPAMGNITIAKTDKATGEGLAGVVFEIRAADNIITPDGTVRATQGEVVDTVTTSEKGAAKSKKLYLGKYKVREKKQKPGYVLPDKVYKVELKYKDQETAVVTENIDVTNVLTEIIIEKKVDGSDQKLSGVKFAVWNKAMTEGEDPEIAEKQTIITSRKGEAVLKGLLPDTTYCIQEVGGVPGYMMDDGIREIAIDKDGKIGGKGRVTVTVENARTEMTATKAVSADTATKEGIPKKKASIKDSVSLKNLQVGEKYTIRGILMDKETKIPLLSGDALMRKEVTSEKTFIATAKEMDVEMVFSFDASRFAGKTAVVFERAYIGENEIASHTDIEDKLQMVSFPEHSIGTKAKDSDTGTHEAIAKKDITLVDTVKYKNLIVGQEYTLKGILIDKSTGKPLLVGGKEVVAETTFSPEKKDGSVEVRFTFDASSLTGKEIVVFESLHVQGTEVAVHADIDDKGQTIEFPEHDIGTKAKDSSTGTQEAIAKKDITLVDTVEYKNLIVGQEYTLKGILMDKSTGKPLLVGGKEVVAETTFSPEKKDGSVEVKFTFDASGLTGKEVVVFESLHVLGTEVAVHADIEDKGQTIEFPEHSIGTKAKDSDTGTQEAIAKKDITLVDTVEYKNLIVGQEYTLKGILMDKSTGEPLLVGGKEVVAETTFTPEKKDGSVEVYFTFDASELNNKEIVVFERLYVEETEVAEHTDIKDKGQTVMVRVGKIVAKKPVQHDRGLLNSIKTGDMTVLLPMILLLLISAGVIAVLHVRRKKHGKRE